MLDVFFLLDIYTEIFHVIFNKRFSQKLFLFYIQNNINNIIFNLRIFNCWFRISAAKVGCSSLLITLFAY